MPFYTYLTATILNLTVPTIWNEDLLNCNNVEAFANIMFGEGENQNEEARLDLAKFLYSESLKAKHSTCLELTVHKDGGAFKYTSMNQSLNIRKQKNLKKYKEIYQFAFNNLDEIYNNYDKMVDYDHYITVELAINNPPYWFKNYIQKYKISGDHVFVKLNFKNKTDVVYLKMLAELLDND